MVVVFTATAFQFPAAIETLVASYSRLLFERPLLVILVSLVLFALLPLCVLLAFPLNLDGNPEKVRRKVDIISRQILAFIAYRDLTRAGRLMPDLD